ncbi:MAG: hypothetical protein JO266_16635 [Acidobacteria bacterium]|nr:hypothetical protein [Acidobacteriota bacterium]
MTSYFTPPTAMMTTVCTGTISLLDMAMYALLAVLFLLTCVGIPRMASELIGGPLGHALEDLASAYYLGRTLASPPLRPAARALRGTVNGAIEGGKEAWRRRYPSQQTMQSFAADVAAQARARSAAQPTKALSPFNGKQPGYNMRNAYGVQVTQPLNPQAQNMGAKPTNKI